MGKMDVHYSAKTPEWETPQWLFDALDEEFCFTLDACASNKNFKVDRFFTRKENGLIQDWRGYVVWMNPPYGREIAAWIEKAHNSSSHAIVVGLVPSRTDTRWWHDHIQGSAEVRFIKGRLKFSGAKHNAPFPCAVVIWRNP